MHILRDCYSNINTTLPIFRECSYVCECWPNNHTVECNQPSLTSMLFFPLLGNQDCPEVDLALF